MAGGADAGEHLQARQRGRVGGLGRVLSGAIDPRLEVGGAQRHHLHPHAGVRQAAELGALPEVEAGIGSLDLPGRELVGHGVALAVEGGDPERVDHIARGDDQLDLLAGGDDHLARCDDVGRRQRLGIAVGSQIGQVDLIGEVVAELPPPLVAHHHHGRLPIDAPVVDGDAHDVGLGGVHGGKRPQHDSRHRGHGHEEPRGPADLQRNVAVGLGGPVVVAVVALDPVPPDQPDHGDRDSHEHHRRDPEHRQHRPGVQLLGDGALRGERVEFGVGRAAAGHRRAQQHQRPGDDAAESGGSHLSHLPRRRSARRTLRGSQPRGGRSRARRPQRPAPRQPAAAGRPPAPGLAPVDGRGRAG